MKKTIFTLAIAIFVGGVLFMSCNSKAEEIKSSKENVEDAQVKLDEAKQEYEENLKKFKLEANEKISTNEKLIMDLKAYSKDKKKEAKVSYEKSINDLEARNKALKERMSDYKEERSDKWESFKEEFNHDMNEIGQSIKDLGKDNVK